MQIDRRKALKLLAAATGAAILMPTVSLAADAKDLMGDLKPKVPSAKWDAVKFNIARGKTGAIPAGYMVKIEAADGIPKHLGKHLPYVPTLPAAAPEGYLPIMWGDAKKGYARHPNAAKSEKKPAGHWYDSIRVRKAVKGEAEEVVSTFAAWPGDKAAGYTVFGGGEITADGGRNTIYMVKLPKGVKKGDTVRIFAHCLTHGEYLDFVTI